MTKKTEKTVALVVFGGLLLAVAGSFLLVGWGAGEGLLNGLRIAGLVVSVLAGFYAAGVDAAPRAPVVRLPGKRVEDGSNAFLPDGNVNRAAGSLGRAYQDLNNDE